MSQHIFMDDRKYTVSSAKIRKNEPDVFVVRTYAFGQFRVNDLGKEHTIRLDEEKQFRVKMKWIMHNPRFETIVFSILREEAASNEQTSDS